MLRLHLALERSHGLPLLLARILAAGQVDDYLPSLLQAATEVIRANSTDTVKKETLIIE